MKINSPIDRAHQHRLRANRWIVKRELALRVGLVLRTGCIPPCNWIRITSTSAAGLPVVPFFTVPWTVAP